MSCRDTGTTCGGATASRTSSTPCAIVMPSAVFSSVRSRSSSCGMSVVFFSSVRAYTHLRFTAWVQSPGSDCHVERHRCHLGVQVVLTVKRITPATDRICSGRQKCQPYAAMGGLLGTVTVPGLTHCTVIDLKQRLLNCNTA
jgi:hypothetical protein